MTIKPLQASPAEALRLSLGDVAAGKLAPHLAGKGRPEVLLFIFDQSGYGVVRASIDGSGLSIREVDVPLALRSAADPQLWSPGFQSLFGLDLDAQAFQQRLQQILVGGGRGEKTDGDAALVPTGAGHPFSSTGCCRSWGSGGA